MSFRTSDSLKAVTKGFSVALGPIVNLKTLPHIDTTSVDIVTNQEMNSDITLFTAQDILETRQERYHIGNKQTIFI